MESNFCLSNCQVLRWLEERGFQPRLVNGNGAIALTGFTSAE
jgi:hypothetical protein